MKPTNPSPGSQSLGVGVWEAVFLHLHTCFGFRARMGDVFSDLCPPGSGHKA